MAPGGRPHEGGDAVAAAVVRGRPALQQLLQHVFSALARGQPEGGHPRLGFGVNLCSRLTNRKKKGDKDEKGQGSKYRLRCACGAACAAEELTRPHVGADNVDFLQYPQVQTADATDCCRGQTTCLSTKSKDGMGLVARGPHEDGGYPRPCEERVSEAGGGGVNGQCAVVGLRNIVGKLTNYKGHASLLYAPANRPHATFSLATLVLLLVDFSHRTIAEHRHHRCGNVVYCLTLCTYLTGSLAHLEQLLHDGDVAHDGGFHQTRDLVLVLGVHVRAL